MTSYSDTEAARDHAPATDGPVTRDIPTTPPRDHRAAARDDRSIADLLRELRDESSTLLRQEVALAKTELGEKASAYGKNLGLLVGGGAALALGGLLLLHGVALLIAFLLDLVLPYSAAIFIGYLIVGAILAIVGYSLYGKAMAAMKQISPVPQKTVDSLNADKEWAKNKVKS